MKNTSLIFRDIIRLSAARPKSIQNYNLIFIHPPESIYIYAYICITFVGWASSSLLVIIPKGEKKAPKDV